jgi:hypothetical protein
MLDTKTRWRRTIDLKGQRILVMEHISASRSEFPVLATIVGGVHVVVSKRAPSASSVLAPNGPESWRDAHGSAVLRCSAAAS